MNKQEEIREGIVASFREFRLNTRLNREPDAYCYTDELLKKLVSQGVVIKVDDSLAMVVGSDGVDRIPQYNYVAVEPIIED